MEFLIIGIVVAANIVFIFIKFDKERTVEGIVDLLLLIVVTFVFSGTYGALVVGTIGSLLISIYLYIKPPKFTNLRIKGTQIDQTQVRKFTDELRARATRRYL